MLGFTVLPFTLWKRGPTKRWWLLLVDCHLWSHKTPRFDGIKQERKLTLVGCHLSEHKTLRFDGRKLTLVGCHLSRHKTPRFDAIKQERKLTLFPVSVQAMASLKKSNEAKDDEKKKKKKTTGSSTTKPTSKIEKKKTSSTKNLRKPNPKTCSNKKNKATQNGTVEDPVIVEVTPSSSDSEKENEEEQNPKSNGKITKNPPAKVTSPRKRSKKERGGDEGNGAEKGEEKICKIPINRTKRIIKSEDPDCLITQEALFLVNKATVSSLFLQLFSIWIRIVRIWSLIRVSYCPRT